MIDSFLLPSLAMGLITAGGIGAILMLPYWLGLK